MKYYFILIMFFSLTTIYCQQVDDNTLLINKYFENTNNSQTLKLATIIQNQDFVNLSQIGDDNNIYINNANKDTQVIIQRGDQNNYEHYSYYNNYNSNIKVSQNGDQNSLLIFGENSISKDLKILQKSNYKSMVIKNFSN